MNAVNGYLPFSLPSFLGSTCSPPMPINGLVNGEAPRTPRAIHRGVFAPVPTFFTEGTQDLGESSVRYQSQHSITHIGCTISRLGNVQNPCCESGYGWSWGRHIWHHG